MVSAISGWPRIAGADYRHVSATRRGVPARRGPGFYSARYPRAWLQSLLAGLPAGSKGLVPQLEGGGWIQHLMSRAGGGPPTNWLSRPSVRAVVRALTRSLKPHCSSLMRKENTNRALNASGGFPADGWMLGEVPPIFWGNRRLEVARAPCHRRGASTPWASAFPETGRFGSSRTFSMRFLPERRAASRFRLGAEPGIRHYELRITLNGKRCQD
jgi:hypothetical protein